MLRHLLGQVRSNRWVRRLVGPVYWRLKPADFGGSAAYWEDRYASGGTSGPGSTGRLADYKAEVLNAFVVNNDVQSVFELGCGDGSQLLLAEYPRYQGVDVSEAAVQRCREMFADDQTKSFHLLNDDAALVGELGLSLDVIYHLTEDAVYSEHMRTLFDSASRFVAVYASNTDVNRPGAPHVRNRLFTTWTDEHADGWRLQAHLPNPMPATRHGSRGSIADFYFFERSKEFRGTDHVATN